MAINGISSYLSNMYKSTNTNNLSALLRNTTLNNQMIKQAYKNLSDINSNKSSFINRTDTTENIIKEFYEKENTDSILENEKALKENTASMRESSFGLLSAESMKDEDFVNSVKAFAENYNNTVNTLKESENFVAVSSGIHMVNTTRSYSASLERAGITVNDDNTLTVNESALKENISHAKNMFSGNYSFGGKMAKKASDLQTLARLSASSGIYNRFGIFYGSGNK